MLTVLEGRDRGAGWHLLVSVENLMASDTTMMSMYTEKIPGRDRKPMVGNTARLAFCRLILRGVPSLRDRIDPC